MHMQEIPSPRVSPEGAGTWTAHLPLLTSRAGAPGFESQLPPNEHPERKSMWVLTGDTASLCLIQLHINMPGDAAEDGPVLGPLQAQETGGRAWLLASLQPSSCPWGVNQRMN